MNEIAGFLSSRSSFPLRAEVHACDRELPLSEREHRPMSSLKLPGRCSFAETVVEERMVDGVDRPSFALKVHPS